MDCHVAALLAMTSLRAEGEAIHNQENKYERNNYSRRIR